LRQLEAPVKDRSIPAQRRIEILEQLEKNGFIRSSTLSEILSVSEATLRRDLDIMERQGAIERTHGGAMISRRMQTEPVFSAGKETFSRQKELIGAAAAALVEPGETIFINFGATSTQVARCLKSRAGLSNVTVITNNISVLQELQNESAFDIICLGGQYRSRSHSLVGTLTLKCLDGIYASRAFIGVDGISLKCGCTTPVETDAEISRRMIENTNGQVVVVADSSKWGVVSNFRVAALNRISALITDGQFPSDAARILEAVPIQVAIAGGRG